MDGFQIEKIELFKVPPRWLFLKITTKNGIEGWGEPLVEGRADTVMAAVEELKTYILGNSAMLIEDTWQKLYRTGFYRGGPILMSAIAGIDQALWDIKGKALNVPVFELLGGAVRDKMKVYGWIGGDNFSNLAEQASKRVSSGYSAVKMNACSQMEWIETPRQIQNIIDRAVLVRETVGDNIGVGIDFHGRIHKSVAKIVLRELEAVKPMFVEEPVLPENNDALRMLQQHTSIPIATGERMYTRWDFKSILQEGIVDIIQPDLSHAGGISEVKRIASMAEAFDVAVAPHCPLGPISFASALQLDFCTINSFIQETSLGMHYNEGADLLDYVKNPEIFDLEDGFIQRFTGPGLGIEIDEKKVIEMSKQGHNWKNPVWRNVDGSITEW